MTTDPAYCSPPCTTRWPTAVISCMLPMMPCSGSVRAALTSSMAALWCGTCTSRLISPRADLWQILPFSSPIRSTMPRPMLTRWGICQTSYLSEELPQLMTRILRSDAALSMKPSAGAISPSLLPDTGGLCYHTEVMAGLVCHGGALGDFITTLPAIRAWRRLYPAGRVVLLGRPAHAALCPGLFDEAWDAQSARFASLFGGVPVDALAAAFSGFERALVFSPASSALPAALVGPGGARDPSAGPVPPTGRLPRARGRLAPVTARARRGAR